MVKEKIYQSVVEDESLEVDDKPEFEDDVDKDTDSDSMDSLEDL